MVSRFIPLVIGNKTIVHGTLDDEEKWAYQTIQAHVTEVNGAQVQNDLFGKQYSMTWVARIRGNIDADSVSFMKNGVPDDQLEKLSVIQVGKHAMRTDIFFSNDLEVNTDELE